MLMAVYARVCVMGTWIVNQTSSLLMFVDVRVAPTSSSLAIGSNGEHVKDAFVAQAEPANPELHTHADAAPDWYVAVLPCPLHCASTVCGQKQHSTKNRRARRGLKRPILIFPLVYVSRKRQCVT